MLSNYTLTGVRFIEDHLFKPRASVLVSRPANWFPFLSWDSTMEAAFNFGNFIMKAIQGVDYRGIKSLSRPTLKCLSVRIIIEGCCRLSNSTRYQNILPLLLAFLTSPHILKVFEK